MRITATADIIRRNQNMALQPKLAAKAPPITGPKLGPKMNMRVWTYLRLNKFTYHGPRGENGHVTASLTWCGNICDDTRAF